jgi:hypothetical protein
MGSNNCRGSVKFGLLALAAFASCAALAQSTSAPPRTTHFKCPVGFEELDLRYNHAGGESVPQLRLAFTNRTNKTITSFVFALAILDSDGNPAPYPSEFDYAHEFPPSGPQRSRTWTLNPASVDMHRSGESVTLLETNFADGKIWKDDGSRSCSFSFDYRAR